MALGYDGKLYILAFDHRGSFQKKMFGIEGEPSQEETDTISDAKKLIYEGMEKAVKQGLDASSAGVLVDEQFGSDIPELAPKEGLSLTMPAEKSGQNEFDFQYGDEFGDHIAKYDLLATKVLVRHNPDPDEKEIRAWLEGNLCRCTGYQNIVRAVKAGAAAMRAGGAESAGGRADV